MPHCGMFALTVRQPWASLIAAGLKVREFRSWSTKHRGALWIHAGAAIVCGADDLPRGVLICRVDLVACVRAEPARWVWLLRNPRLLSVPVPCRGAQGLWRLTPEQMRAVSEQLGR